MDNNEERKGTAVSFAALDPYIQKNIISPDEKEDGRKGYVTWGDGNQYPNYCHRLYQKSTTLRSVVNGFVDYVCGDDVIANFALPGLKAGILNEKGLTVREAVQILAKSIGITGGFGLDVVRNLVGEIASISAIDCEELRCDKEGNEFWYSEEWAAPFGARIKSVKIGKFIPNAPHQEEGILFVKNTELKVYPEPLFAAAVKACETEIAIDDFHLNSISNGFMGSYLVNFCNGIPGDEQMKEIEKNFNRKFSGHENAGRVIFNYADSKDTAATMTKLDLADFASRYESLAKHCRQQIFTAFRANPNLFGIPTESLGFSNEEYEAAFKLFNRTVIKPVQRTIVDAFDKVLGMQGSITINPFTLDGDAETNVE